MLRASGLLLALTVTLAGCGGGTSLTSEAPPDKPQVTDVMGGRRAQTAPHAPSGGLTFTPPSATTGSAVPDGGCPERFYLSRRWQLADGTLTILDADNTPLGSFRVNGDRFDGKSDAGTALTLSR